MNLKDGFHADGPLQSLRGYRTAYRWKFCSYDLLQNFLLRNFYTEVEFNLQ